MIFDSIVGYVTNAKNRSSTKVPTYFEICIILDVSTKLTPRKVYVRANQKLCRPGAD